jgi:hypothetical protein
VLLRLCRPLRIDQIAASPIRVTSVRESIFPDKLCSTACHCDCGQHHLLNHLLLLREEIITIKTTSKKLSREVKIKVGSENTQIDGQN